MRGLDLVCLVTEKKKFNNVYVKNLSESSTGDNLKNIFGEYGAVTSDGKSKCLIGHV